MKSKKNLKIIERSINQYPVVVQEDISGGYWVSCPFFDGCYSQGDTIDEALTNIKEAIALCLEETKRTKIASPLRDVSLHYVHL